MNKSDISTISGWNKHDWLVSLLMIVLATLWAFSAQLPSAQSYQGDDPKVFSQKNALKHLKVISEKPHFVGSSAHRTVREYLVSELQKLGLTVDTFEHLSTHSHAFIAMNTKNVVARIKGSSNSKALALVSHYDSRSHSSLGASDAGSGVVTILEGLRTFLANGKQPKNDIIILFTDAEEEGLLGAQAVVRYHKWAKDIGLVLNFEARGTGGPSYMFIETNGGNKKLVEAFSDADVNFPVANSLMYALYKLLPNDTDTTAFREQADIDGFNFAFIDDHFDYHTKQDSYQRLDRESLNHQSDYLMATLNYFAFADLTQMKSEQDMVYFNFPGLGMVIYPNSWVMPMVLIACLLLALITYMGLKRNILSGRAILAGFAPLTISLISAGLIGYLGWQAMLVLFPQYAEISQGFTYNGHWIIACFISLTCAATLTIYRIFNKRYRSNDLQFAPLTLWLVINIAIALTLPGAGFFIIPLYFGIIVFYLKIFAVVTVSKQLLVATLLALPSLILFSPLVPLFIIGLGLKMMALGAVLSCLLLVLLISVFCHYRHLHWLSNSLVTIGLVFLVISAAQSSYTADRKKPNSINYIYDQDSNAGYIFSYNKSFDDYIGQFISHQDVVSPWDAKVYPEGRGRKIRYYQSTNKLELISADIQVIKDQITNEKRTIALLITPGRATNIIRLASNNALHINEMSVNGQQFTNKDQVISRDVRPGIFFHYVLSSPNEQITVELTVPKASELSLKVYGIAFDLVEKFADIAPRSQLYMPEPFLINDATIIGQSVKLL